MKSSNSLGGLRVGIWYDRPVSYRGGLNYSINLVRSLVLAGLLKDQITVFLPRNVDKEISYRLERYCTVKRTSLLQRFSLGWLFERLAYKLLGHTILARSYMFSQGVNCSYFNHYPIKASASFRSMLWLPDLQAFIKKDYHSGAWLKSEEMRIKAGIAHSSGIVFSSYSAMDDLKRLGYKDGRFYGLVAQFPSTICKDMEEQNVLYFEESLERLGIGRNSSYIFCPNQFWPHKGHLTLLRSIFMSSDMLMSNNIKLIFTGHAVNSRGHFLDTYVKCKNYIDENRLSDIVLYLGELPYSHIVSLYMGCFAVVNPSEFEGWSTSVEEAKALDKHCLLSDIDVHKEQTPDKSIFFKSGSFHSLSNALETLLLNTKPESRQAYICLENIMRDRENMTQKTEARMQHFGDTLIRGLLG